ncbi:hypothetical protein LRP49_08175 [Enterovibrio sp. ZSDZ35]|uniref:Uncharacterized protein n=1 Tax=Enterovibrio qingdaonensis TaxID=2899818 RepID=A0ABT5QJL3_9GAMM|nr:hypothetical protein [Enterovibrio sp. ZSDZ35]MDD1781181.1 hypothetical protein [Enterovibrio sp. ZSDZ35]
MFRNTLPRWAVLALLVASPITTGATLAISDSDKQFGHSDYYGPLTPTQVFSLMQSVDALVTHYATHQFPERSAWLPTRQITVENYRPEDVFVALSRLSDLVDQLALKHKVRPTHRIERERDLAIPAEVFLQAGECLDTLALVMNSLSPDEVFGDFYANNSDSKKQNKTPSDVFALVDLIVRKLNTLLSEERSTDE